MNHLTLSLRRLVVAALVLLTMPAFAQLSGTYTINPTGSGTSNYVSFTAAISALDSLGLSGPVTFNVAPGIYNEQILLDGFSGDSNRVTFQGPSTAVLTYSPTGSADNYTVFLNGCSNVTFNGFTVQSGGTSIYGRVFQYSGNVKNIDVLGMTIEGHANGSTSSNMGAFGYSGTHQQQGVWNIKNNVVSNVSYGFYFYGTTTTAAGYTTAWDSVFIENNEVSSVYYPVYTRYAKYVRIANNNLTGGTTTSPTGLTGSYIYFSRDGVEITGNTTQKGGFFVSNSSNPAGFNTSVQVENNDINEGFYGVYAYATSSASAGKINRLRIVSNKITNGTYYGIYTGYIVATPTYPAVIENNFVHIKAASFGYGIYNFHSANLYAKHNSVNMEGGANHRGVYSSKSTSTTIFPATDFVVVNNIISAPGGQCVYTLNNIASMQNNVYWSNNPTPFYTGTNVAYSAFSTTHDSTGAFGNPYFFSNTDLHAQGPVADGLGVPVGTLEDIDGAVRSVLAPDAGADEFSAATCLPPSGLVATSVTNTSAVISWTASATTAIGYQLKVRSGTASTYSLSAATTANVSGLMASSTYYISTRAICSQGDTSLWSEELELKTEACSPADQCMNTIYMTDSYGDGWNNNKLELLQNGVVVKVFGAGFTNGFTAPAETFMLCGGAVTTARLIAGSYTYEVGFTIVGPSGDTLLHRVGANSGPTLQNGHVFGSFNSCVGLTCAPANQCGYTVTMTDAFGDGWNNTVIDVFQNGSLAGSFGQSFTTGSLKVDTLLLCDGLPVTVKARNAGSWSSEVGFTISSPFGVVGVIHQSGTSFSNTKVFGSFNAFCAEPTCPVTDTVTGIGGSSCGVAPVALAAQLPTGSNAAGIVWMNGSGQIVGSGNSYTTDPISSTQTFTVAAYANDNQLEDHVVGPPSTLAGGFGNFTNGMWFTANKTVTIDSVTVRSTGTAGFRVRISEGQGSISAGNVGDELQRSNLITTSGTGTHKVPVGVTVSPGTYYINLAYEPGYTGTLHRATAGAQYPYVVQNVISVDSVYFPTQVRAYYLYDWNVSESCVGPATSVVATFVPEPSTSLPYSVDFNGGIPCNWSVNSASGAEWTGKTGFTNSFYNNLNATLNGSSFVMVDDDAVGSSVTTSEAIMQSPELDLLGHDSLVMSFQSIFKGGSWGGKGYVEVYAPVLGVMTWVKIDSITADEGCTAAGTWTTAVQKTYNIDAYKSSSFKARLRYNDGGQWAGWWAVDNFVVDGNLIPCTNVRVAITTDVYGSEVTWSIRDINTGIVWATGGPYADVSPYNASTATHIDTLCLPDNGTYEFQINDSYGDGLFDGTNTGTYAVDKLCAWGWNNVLTGSGAQPYGSTTNPPSYDSVVFDMSCFTNVTFQVDMNRVTQGFTTPEVNGLWNNWCGNCNAMSDANGDGIWEVTIPLAPGSTQEFKYSADAWTIQEMNDPTAPCTNGNATYTNRVLVVPAADTTLPVVCWSSCYGCTVDVTLQVNMAWEVANNAISADGIHVAGDFQGWNPGATMMTDANSDGIYEVTVSVPANSSIQYKFINGNAWGADESVPAACQAAGSWNRGASFVYADSTIAPVCFGKCTDCMASLDEAFQNVSLFPNPTRGQFNLARMDAASEVEVSVLDLQGKVLTVATWAAGAELLNIDLGNFANGVYMVRMTSEEGSRTLRVSVQK